MKPIETWYQGRKYRSRLEARWAVFFTVAGIAFDYEPEGFDFGNGLLYLPDFWLPGVQAWAEIKGPDATARDVQKCTALAGSSGKRVFMFAGQFEPLHPPLATLFNARHGDGFVEEDAPYAWVECSVCRELGIVWEGQELDCGCVALDPFEYPCGRLQDAHAAALAARFEFGNAPVPGFTTPAEVLASAELREALQHRRLKDAS